MIAPANWYGHHDGMMVLSLYNCFIDMRACFCCWAATDHEEDVIVTMMLLI